MSHLSIIFSDDERHTLTGALYTANDRYRECIKTTNEDALLNPDAKKRLVQTFEKQIADCTALLERIEE